MTYPAPPSNPNHTHPDLSVSSAPHVHSPTFSIDQTGVRDAEALDVEEETHSDGPTRVPSVANFSSRTGEKENEELRKSEDDKDEIASPLSGGMDSKHFYPPPQTLGPKKSGKALEENFQESSSVDWRAYLAREREMRVPLLEKKRAAWEEKKGFKGLRVVDGGDEEAKVGGGKGKKEDGLTVVWDGLIVEGMGGMKIHIRTFPNALMEFFLTPLMPFIFKPSSKQILRGEAWRGMLKPGEMCLVLGRPGSGCSTFLKAITNRRISFRNVTDSITYSGLPSHLFDPSQTYQGLLAYSAEEDLHLPTLTVSQTFDFASKTKTLPEDLWVKEEGEGSKEEWREKVRERTMKMLNISHTRGTLVGNEWVRGVSGGERKRVSIGEALITDALVFGWDNSTRGLDASTALDFTKMLRNLTDTMGKTTFVSLYQAGEGIYDLFDKVLVINEGRCVYFGDAKKARKHFVDLGYQDLQRQTTADYLTGCTDPNERRFQSGRSEADVPSTPEALEAAYLSSSVYKEVSSSLESYVSSLPSTVAQTSKNLAITHAITRNKMVSPTSPYMISFWEQTLAITKRQFALKLQDRLGLSVAYATSTIIAIITGSVYLNLPTSAAGGFTRGGVLFLALLFNSFQAFNELPTQMIGRAIVWKQKEFTFYRPSAVALASTLADIPINFIQIFIFSVIIYFMTGLDSNAGAFFTFFALIYAGFQALSSFFRLLGCMCTSYDVAARMAASLVSLMVLYSGYLIPVEGMKKWLFWIYYMNPINWGFEALMSNEFDRLTLTCDGAYVVPHNVGDITKYPTTIGDNQVCTLAGSTAGSAVIPGIDYIKSAFHYQYGIAWRNFGFLVAYFILFQFLQCLAMEKLKLGAGMPAIQVFKKEDKELKELNAKLQEKKDDYRKGKIQQDVKAMVEAKKPFTWEKLTYDVPVAGGQKRLLNEIYGYVLPGTLTALMGSSGAGKTTLLDVLADRKTIGVIGGDVKINGRPIGRDFQRSTAYCEQLDTHEWTATVREAFRFSAYLRQPAHVSKAEKDAYVEEIIQLLEMEDLADSMIGFPGFGLDVEARKRLTIGVELAAKPELLLFLDEPTSGLDGQSAYNIVRFLRKLAASGQAILCTIHQPSALLFEHFDRLLLLQRGGNTVYFGDIGKDSAILRNYLAKNGADCPPSANPAEFMLEAIGAGSSKMIGDVDWGERWLQSPEFAKVKQEIADIKSKALETPEEDKSNIKEYATSFPTQLQVVSIRALKGFWRNADYGFTRLFNHVIIALLTGLTFIQLGNGLVDLQYRVFVIFIATVLPAIIISQVEPTFIMARNTFIRESSSKMYSQVVFALGQLVAEVPYSVLCAVGFFLPFYYIPGFQSASSRAGYQFFMIIIVEFFAVTLGQAVAALSPSIFIAASINPFLLIITSVFCGVTIPYPSIPGFWKAWLYHLNPLTYMIAGMVATELHDLPVVCRDSEFYIFNPPSGQTCQDWAGDYVTSAGGYLNNPDATTGCQYCEYSAGDQFYGGMNITFGTRWRNLGILIAFTAFNAFITVMASRFLKYAKR